jgi:hypothetical protein
MPSEPFMGEQQRGSGPPRQEVRPRGGRGRGRGRGQGGPQPASRQLNEPAGDGGQLGAAAQTGGQVDISMPQRNEQGLERPNSRQRRRERPPRAKQQQQSSEEQQQQRQGAGSGLRALEVAASAAANQRQWQQQDAEAHCAGESSASEADGDGGQAAPTAGATPQPPLGANQQQAQVRVPQPGRAQKPSSRQRSGGQIEARAAAADRVADVGGAGQGDATAAHPEAPQCLVCCSEMAEVGLGACNHKAVCGTCTLRLRLCYGRRDCPLCKAELKEVRLCLSICVCGGGVGVIGGGCQSALLAPGCVYDS